MGAMATVANIEILAADRTKTLAVRFANGADGDLEQGIVADHRLEIDLGIFRDEQAEPLTDFSVNA